MGRGKPRGRRWTWGGDCAGAPCDSSKLLPWESAHLDLNLPTPLLIDPESGAFQQPRGAFRRSMLVPYVLLGLWTATMAWTWRRQSVHDLVARTIVRAAPNPTLEDAIALAAHAHRGQVYPSPGGEPFILHPLRVMLRVEGTSDQIVTVLHDLVEDTAYALTRWPCVCCSSKLSV